MNDLDGLYLAIGLLWFGVLIAFVMKFYGYRVTADLSMSLILCCFTALAMRHHSPIPQITPAASASEAKATTHVTRPGDGNYHSPDCERLIGTSTIQYEPLRGQRAPCVDCILPHMHRSSGGEEIAKHK